MFTLTINGGKFWLSFPYDEDAIARVQAIPCASWNRVYRVWEFPMTFSAYSTLKEEFGVSHPEIENELKKKRKTVVLSGHVFKTVPFDHQIEAMKFLLTKFGMKVR